jgi:hypothetical protein
MANVSRVNGLRPVKHLNGSAYNGQTNLYYVPASDGTAMGVGDLVKLAGSASADGYATVAQSAAGDASVGVVVGFVVDLSNLNQVAQYRTASTARYVLVADATDIVYEVQEDAVGGALAVTAVGLNANVVVAAPSATTGLSGMQLDSSTAATTATLNLKILGFSTRQDNEIGVANAKVLVTINNHQFGSSTGTAGV